jgi:hypothetical protein
MDELLREGLALCDDWKATHPATAEATRAILRRKHEAGTLDAFDIETLRGGVRVTQQARADAARA